LGIMTTDQLEEVDWLVREQGVASFSVPAHDAGGGGVASVRRAWTRLPEPSLRAGGAAARLHRGGAARGRDGARGVSQGAAAAHRAALDRGSARADRGDALSRQPPASLER